MSKAAALLTLGLAVLLALLGLVSVTAQSDRLMAAGSVRVAPAPPLPPAEGALNPAEPVPGVTLTH